VTAGSQQGLVNAEFDCLSDTPRMRNLTVDAISEYSLVLDNDNAGAVPRERQGKARAGQSSTDNGKVVQNSFPQVRRR
jgi:hypothetical protein